MKISDNEWKLGISSYDQTISTDDASKVVVTRTHYTKIITGTNTNEIIEWKSIVDTSNERKVSIELNKT